MDRIQELIQGGYDLHVHSAPDVLPRKMDDIEMAERIRNCTLAGYAIKSHYFVTSERAQLINKLFPECDAVGTMTLNSSIGGVNPTAVEMGARSGVKLVWFPTCDSAHEIAHTFNGDPNKKLPYWAKIVIEMKDEGIAAPTINVLGADGELTENTLHVLDIIARYDIILATGHISHEEAYKLVPEAAKRGVKKIIITHVDFPTTYYSVEDQKKFVDCGAVMEHCYTTWATGKVDFEVTKRMIREVGPEHCILATDLGQKTAVYPDEGVYEFARKLVEAGFSDEDIRNMVVRNPRKLLNKKD